MVEKDLQSKCNKYLRDNGILYIHRQKGRTHKPTSQNNLIMDGVKMTYPDLIIMPYNQYFFYIELKTKTGKLKEEQINYMQYAKAKGHAYYVCTDYNEFLEVMSKELK